jgi:hypothetical protein
VALWVVIGFAGVWAIVLWQAHSSLTILRRHPSLGGVGPQRLAPVAPAAIAASSKQSPENPYYGWQPPIPKEMACSWRDCLKKGHVCPTCRDSELDLLAGLPENVLSTNWIPDVTMLHRMMLEGKDAQGRPWPPPLDDELCEPMGVSGGRHDDNKVCEYQ